MLPWVFIHYPSDRTLSSDMKSNVAGHTICHGAGHPGIACKRSNRHEQTKRPVSIHYNDVIMISMASQITVVSFVYSTVCSGADQRKHQSSASLAFMREIQLWPVNSPQKRPVTRKMLPSHDVIMVVLGIGSPILKIRRSNDYRIS